MTNYPNGINLLKGDLVEDVAKLLATHAQEAVEEHAEIHFCSCDIDIDPWVDWEKKEFYFGCKVDSEFKEVTFGLDTPVMEMIEDLTDAVEGMVHGCDIVVGGL